MKLMIVDDSEVISKRLKELLQDIEDLEIAAIVEDGIQAIAQFTILNPEITILDLMIPRMNGLDVLRSIRSKNQNTVIIILTNYDQSYFRDRCTELGANYFLDKSADFEKVYQICQNTVHPKNINNTDCLLLKTEKSK
jgi:DNA-binding NarL/FixJ family response regulator